MLLTALAIAALLRAGDTPADTLPAEPIPEVVVAPELLASAYMDQEAAELVRLGRQRRDQQDRSVTEYSALAKERISVGVRALRRDRVLYRREMAANILWRRDGTGVVQVLGSRQVVPIAVPEPHVPSQPASQAADLAFDPSRELLLSGFSDDDIHHPLADGSEAHYRFASGDTTRIRLQGGRELRVAELRIIPRRLEGLLLRGSLWLDLETHAAVRGVFQLARPLDMARDLEEDDDEIPGILQPIRADLRYLTVDYALLEDRWWLPRLISIEGEATLGSLATVPVRFERSYEDFEVSGTGIPPLPTMAWDTLRSDTVPEGKDSSVVIGIQRECDDEQSCWRYRYSRAADSVLLASEHLPPSIYDEGTGLITEEELRELAGLLGVDVPGRRPWHPPVTSLSYLGPGLMRYNRVEGLALAGRLEADFGAAELDATLWMATADLLPKGELGIRRERFGTTQRVAVYRRLAAVEPDSRALGFGSSLTAVLLGRDDGDYYRTLGAEITGAAAAPRLFDYRWRAFAERQSAAERGTELNLPRLFEPERAFHENIVAEPADQAGLDLAGSFRWGSDPLGLRWVLGGSLLAATGDYGFVRPSVTASAGFPLPVGGVAAVEVSGGTVAGDAPVQALWYLGGPSTVRGYGGGSRIAGESFWRARAELANSFPAARVALFSDAGWAGPTSAVGMDPMLLSAGIGASFLDGLLRADLARALRGRTGWRVDLYFDGIL